MRANWFWASSGSALLPQPEGGALEGKHGIGRYELEKKQIHVVRPQKSKKVWWLTNQLATAMRT
jgi:hypothetical protein